VIVSFGMWFERFIIVVTSLHRDFLPSSWGMYYPTKWDFGMFFGTIGLFISLAVPVPALPADDFDF
jgi:molybdopterin-containing oxidoreductase family membrane subunit